MNDDISPSMSPTQSAQQTVGSAPNAPISLKMLAPDTRGFCRKVFVTRVLFAVALPLRLDDERWRL